MKKSDKLLKFTLDDGSGTDRTIVSGIRHYYQPEQLIGKTAVAVLNLPPRKMMGIPSCGMLISAVHKEKGEVEIEEMTGAPAAPAVAAAAPAAPAAPAGGEKITAPMPGTILAANVTSGSAVKKGDVLMILEAMKMENEIMAPCDGAVTSVSVTKGAAVESGTLLCTIG